MKSKHIPLRKCVGCNQSKPKKNLIRIVKKSDDEKNGGNSLLIDFNNEFQGRGTYICKDLNCLSTARKYRRLEKRLSQKISDDFYKTLESALSFNE